MKYPVHAILMFSCFFLSSFISAQNLLLNGSFEINNASSSIYNIKHNEVFDTLMPGVFYIAGELSLRMNEPSECSNAKDGEWFITESFTYGLGVFGLTLVGGLQTGKEYLLTFNTRQCYGSTSAWINIGVSNDSSSFGELIVHIAGSFDTTWRNQELIFTPSFDADYITVELMEDIIWTSAGLQADNFYLVDLSTGIENPETSSLSVFPNPVSSSVNISYSIAEPCTLTLTDAFGRIIKSVCLIPSSAIHVIHTDQFPGGVYFLTLLNEKNNISERMVIVK